MLILAIETSCDETAVALWDSSAWRATPQQQKPKSDLLAQTLLVDRISSQVNLHRPYGGVVPELAAREHLVNLPIMVEQALLEINAKVADLGAIAVTRGPGLKGCLLVGLCYAKALSAAANIPLLALNHLEGHIAAGNLTLPEHRPQLPMLALVVSGGHTMLVYVESFRSYRIVAATRDDAAGEAFDKSATMLGLPYPGGPALSKAAESGRKDAYPFPIGMQNSPEHFSFSGLKTAVLRKVTELGESCREPSVVADLSASLEQAIVRSLTEKSIAACKKYRPKSFLLTGGVAANGALRTALAEQLRPLGVTFAVPERKWCTDNAAMIAVLADEIIASNPEPYLQWKASSRDANLLGPETDIRVGPLARWPLEQISGPAGQ